MTNGQDGPDVVRIEATIDVDAGWVALDPSRVRIPDGGEVAWTFSGIPKDVRPALLFESFQPGPGVPADATVPFRGPFRDLTRQEGAIRGTGIEGRPGEYMYKVCLIGKDPGDPLVRRLECRGAPAGGLVKDPGPRSG